ncbi:MAG: 2-oxo acid dehydrogenase subunit E2 [Firmicutes bacterium]|nr:2-oxo acid dehydrogenase subunit E2 [Bacillota bacterium]
MYDFKFADIGEGIHEGVILKWEYNIGDVIEEGETLVIIETDKVNAEIPSPVTGTITKLGPPVGETINVGETLAVIDDGTGTKKDTEATASKPISEGDEENSAGVVGSIEVGSDVIASSEEYKQDSIPQNMKVLATPVARKLAKDLAIDIRLVKGTGENGRVMKDDIYHQSEQMNRTSLPAKKEDTFVSAPSMDEERTSREKISKMRKTIAENMTLSKSTIPHTTVMDEIIISELVTLRRSQKDLANQKDVKLTYMPFIIKALTLALKEHKIFNSSFDQNTDEIIYKNYMNIGIAVDTPNGLMVPNIKNANHLGIFELANQIQVLKEKAMNKKITLDDLRDGTISITNYGVFDSTFGVPVIKFPEVAIIGIGKIAKKPVVIDDEIVIRDVLPLSLSIDHRVIDGGDAGRFLQTFKSYLSNPMLLLLS